MEIIDIDYFKNSIYYISFYLMLIASGCTKKQNIETGLRKDLEQRFANKNCQIDVTQITRFDWDKMIVFDYAVSSETVDDAIGLEYPYFVEFTRPLIFLKNNRIVHYENNNLDVEGPIDGEVVFSYPDSVKYGTYLKRNSIFNVKKVVFDKGVYYILSPKAAASVTAFGHHAK